MQIQVKICGNEATNVLVGKRGSCYPLCAHNISGVGFCLARKTTEARVLMTVQSLLSGYSKSTAEQTCSAIAWKQSNWIRFGRRELPTSNSFLSFVPWTCAIVVAFFTEFRREGSTFGHGLGCHACHEHQIKRMFLHGQKSLPANVVRHAFGMPCVAVGKELAKLLVGKIHWFHKVTSNESNENRSLFFPPHSGKCVIRDCLQKLRSVEGLTWRSTSCNAASHGSSFDGQTARSTIGELSATATAFGAHPSIWVLHLDDWVVRRRWLWEHIAGRRTLWWSWGKACGKTSFQEPKWYIDCSVSSDRFLPEAERFYCWDCYVDNGEKDILKSPWPTMDAFTWHWCRCHWLDHMWQWQEAADQLNFFSGDLVFKILGANFEQRPLPSWREAVKALPRSSPDEKRWHVEPGSLTFIPWACQVRDCPVKEIA